MKRPLRILGAYSRRDFLSLMALAGASLGLSGCASHRKVMSFANWSLFIGKETLANFKKATGIDVEYEELSSADVLFAKIKIGVSGYDLVVTPDYMLRRLIRHNLLLDLPERPPIDTISKRFRNPSWDPDHRYSVPYLWGTTGVAYNPKKVAGEPDSWELLWDPKLERRITMLDEKRDSIGVALIRLGFSGNSVNPDELAQARTSLLEQKKLLRKISSDFADDLIREETWAALAWSGDVHQALGSNPDLRFYLPKEGCFFFVDNLAIPRQAPHPHEAMEFINFYMQPEVAAEVTNSTGYANPIEAATKLVTPDLIDNPLSYPPEKDLARLQFQQDLGEGEHLWDAIWEDFKR